MPLKIYIKDTPKKNKILINYLSYTFLVIGMLLIFWASYPLIAFQLFSSLIAKKTTFSPVPRSTLASSLEIANNVLGTVVNVGPNLKSFTKASLWFPKANALKSSILPEKKAKKKITEYTLSIPKLGIENAKVTVGGEDLDKSLIHYLPTTLPGEPGNVAIFGHSTLPQLYKKNDYKSIFTYLHTLEKGDKIEINIEGVKYIYEVQEMFIVNPDQIEVLKPDLKESIITLVTCTPPGTYWKRLIVRANLVNLPNNP